jgi:hypothetical protein
MRHIDRLLRRGSGGVLPRNLRDLIIDLALEP